LPGSLEDCEEKGACRVAMLFGIHRREPQVEEIGDENQGCNEQAFRMELHCLKSRHAALIFNSFERKLVTDLHSSELSIPNRSAYPPGYFVAASN